MNRRNTTLAVLGAAAVKLAVLHHLGRSTAPPGLSGGCRCPVTHDRPAAPDGRDAHASTLPVPPERVWPWLVQVGWHRGGWYTLRWVDVLLFPANAPSADHLLDEPGALAVGDRVPDGPPETECWFVVREVVPGEHLVLGPRPTSRFAGGRAVSRACTGPGRSCCGRSTVAGRPGWSSAGERAPVRGGSPRAPTC